MNLKINILTKVEPNWLLCIKNIYTGYVYSVILKATLL